MVREAIASLWELDLLLVYSIAEPSLHCTNESGIHAS